MRQVRDTGSLKGLSEIVPTFHRFDPPWVSLGLSEVSEGLSGGLGVCYQCGQELAAWFGPATNWTVAPTVALALVD